MACAIICTIAVISEEVPMAPFTVVLIVLAIASLGIIGTIVAIYNGLVTVRNNVAKSFENIDVVLQQRNDALTKLIDVVKEYMKYEKDLLTKLVELRTGYAQAKDLGEKIRIENELEKLLGKLQMVWEQYPDLKAVQSFLQLQGEVSGIESKLADYRETFNDAVNIFNIQIERFPDLLLAKPLGYQRHAFLEVPVEKKKDVQMKLS
jgi:LemA protein